MGKSRRGSPRNREAGSLKGAAFLCAPGAAVSEVFAQAALSGVSGDLERAVGPERARLVMSCAAFLAREASSPMSRQAAWVRANGLAPMRYLEWLLEELPNTPGADDPAVLGRFMPWSPEVPASCRMTPSEASEPDPMVEPLVDIDPGALDEE